MKEIRIRAITAGIDLDQHNPGDLVEKLKSFYSIAELHFRSVGLAVQTRRLTLPPMTMGDSATCYRIKSTVDTLNRVSDEVDIRWVCLPLRGHEALSDDVIKIIAGIVHSYPKYFMHFMIAENGAIANQFLNSAARAVQAVSRLSSNGYDNFRIGMGANIPPNTPYFPFSYHDGATGFSLAVELIEHLIQIARQVGVVTLTVIRERLINAIVPIIKEIDVIGKDLEHRTGFQYKGQDISIAPFPDESRSVAGLIEMIGPQHCGQSGTLMATSLLTDVLKTAIKQTGIRAAGFNGVMFSPLEDKKLAEVNNQRHLSIEKLMLYSAVCGCGIDMVPVSGDTFSEEMSALALDVAALSTVLKKPLGVRVLPIPMKVVNEMTNFNHDFLTNTRIMNMDGYHATHPVNLDQAFRYLRFDEPELMELAV